jgi:F-type H+-transporting ATPase subunit b
MNSKLKVFSCALGVALAYFAAPAVALAETPSGADILLPKPAEFIPALIAFLIIWFVLAKLAWPSILGMMEKRQQKIQGDLDAAEQARREAETNAEAYQTKILEAEREAEEIRSAARREAEEKRIEILAEAQKEAAATIAKAKDAVANERKKAMIELSGQVVDLSVEIASKIIGNDLSQDAQRRLAERYLQEVTAPDGK